METYAKDIGCYTTLRAYRHSESRTKKEIGVDNHRTISGGFKCSYQSSANLNKVMMRWNLRELPDHNRDNEDSRNQKSLVKLIKLLKAYKKNSKFVENVMDNENDEGAKIQRCKNCVRNNMNMESFRRQLAATFHSSPTKFKMDYNSYLKLLLQQSPHPLSTHGSPFSRLKRAGSRFPCASNYKK